MCRLLGIYSKIHFWKEILLEFQNQAENGKVPPNLPPGHKDGWGITSSNPEKSSMIPIEKQLGIVYQSPLYKEMVDSFEKQPHIVLGHLRKASPQIPISFPNVHPFFLEEWAFIHNGTIYNAEALPRDSTLLLTSDNSDSEIYFHFLVTQLRQREESTKSLETIVSALESISVSFSSLNCIFGNGEELFVVRWCDQLPEYYTLYYYELEEGIIIASEPIQSDNLDSGYWKEFPNRSVARIYGSPPNIEIRST
ncbi:MAG: class II glutamine amidotransferase [Candidatus Hodarchaeales archaeon]|jgi:predicted glutamine amidotransferase